MWSACDLDKLARYLDRFEHDGIHFEYANHNPEVDKLYFNVGIDDKFGFDPDNDWAEVITVLNAHPQHDENSPC